MQDTFIEILEWRAQELGSATAFEFGVKDRECLSFKALYEQACAIAAELQRRHAPGERALLIYPPGLDFVAAFFGCLLSKTIPVPVYPIRAGQRMTALRNIARDAYALFALTSAQHHALLASNVQQDGIFGEFRWIETDRISSETAMDWQRPTVRPGDLAFIQYTSGSTANPKGVMVSHENLCANSEAIRQRFAHDRSSRGVIWLPPYHDMGLIGGILQPVYAGFPVTLMAPVHFLQRPLAWLKIVSETKATTSGGPNFAYDLCTRRVKDRDLEQLDLSAWKIAFCGAEPVHAETIRRFSEKFGCCGFKPESFYPCYGIAESTLMVSGNRSRVRPTVQSAKINAGADEAIREVVGCGQPIDGMRIAIVDLETRTKCNAGEPGEIWLQGSSVTLGYWNRPLESAQSYCAYTADNDGPWLRTGDIGYLSEGQLYIVSRYKDTVIVRGKNLYAHDVEHVVQDAHPGLKIGSGVALSVHRISEEQLIVLQEVERSWLRRVAPGELEKSIRSALMDELGVQADRIVLLPPGEIPRTSSGKVRRRNCRERYLRGRFTNLQETEYSPDVERTV